MGAGLGGRGEGYISEVGRLVEMIEGRLDRLETHFETHLSELRTEQGMAAVQRAEIKAAVEQAGRLCPYREQIQHAANNQLRLNALAEEVKQIKERPGPEPAPVLPGWAQLATAITGGSGSVLGVLVYGKLEGWW